MKATKWTGLFAMLLMAGSAWATPAGSITFLAGTAQRSQAGKVSDIAQGSSVEAGDEIATGKDSRLELTLADRSVVRLGANSKATVREAQFGEGSQKFSAKLLVGKLWAKVASTLGGQSHFNVETDNAVAGVRGTTFRVDAHHDKSVLVRVYAGAVAVASQNRLPQPAHAKGHTEVAGPQEVDKHTYEKLLQKMMEVKVSAEGELGEPHRFAEADDAKEPWVAWNEQRDGN